MKSKTILTALLSSCLFLFFVSCSTTQKTSQTKEENSSNSFEGTITYDLVMEDKTGEMTSEQMKNFMGNEQIYMIKGNKYKTKMNGVLEMTQYYIGGDTLYNHLGENLLWIDSTKNPDELINFEIKENVEKVNGIPCDLLTIQSKKETTHYYFNRSYGINPTDYVKHEYGFWKFCIEKTQSMPLKIINDSEDLHLEMVAKQIAPMKIDESEFILPDLPRLESPEE